MTNRLIARTLPALIAAAFSGPAGAAGFQLWEQNNSGLGNAYAGSAAVAENASTIFFNPAGMTMLQAREFSVGASAVRPSYKFSNNGSLAAPGVPLGGSSGGDAGDWGFVPNAYLSWALSKDLYLGLGVGAPFGLKTEYDSDWIGAAQSIKFDIKTINVNPSIAYRVNDMVSLGAGVSWQKLDVEYLRRAAVTPAGNFQVKLKVDDDAWGWNVGALFKVSPTTRIGASYRSTIKHELEGDISGAPIAALNSNAKVEVKLPDEFILSVVQTLSERWDMLGDISWTGWSTLDKVDIKRSSGPLNGQTAQTLEPNFRDAWRIALGGTYKYTDAMRLKLGIAWDQTPVRNPEHRLTALPDNDRIWLSVGGQWKPTPTSALDVGFAYIIIRDPDINNNQIADGRGLVKGSYDAKAYVLGAQYSMSF